MALQQLMGLLLSVIALFFLLTLLLPLLMNTPSNLKVANANAQSIKDFIDFSNTYSQKNLKQETCYNLLRLHNLENFQIYDSDNKNYFYAIDSENVYVVPIEQLSLLFDSADVKGLYKSKYTFNEKQKIYSDETCQGLPFKIDIDLEVITLWSTGDADTDVKLKDEIKYIVLVPYLSEFEAFKFSYGNVKENLLSWFNNNKNQNVMIPFIIKNAKDYEEYSSFYLISDSNNNLFVSKNSVSEVLAKKNTCSFFDLRDKDNTNYYYKTDKNGNKVLDEEKIQNLVNKKLSKYWLFSDNSRSKEKFVWINGQIKCYEQNKNPEGKYMDTEVECLSELKNVYSYEEFDKIIKTYFLNNENNENRDGGLKDEIEEISEDNIIERKLEFNQFFDVLDYDLSLVKDKYSNEIFDIGGVFGLNRKINGEKSTAANLVQIRNGKIYSYYKTDKNGVNLYYNFNYLNLRKKIDGNGIKLYFNGNYFDVKDIEADGEGIGKGFWGKIANIDGNGDNKIIYMAKISFMDASSNIPGTDITGYKKEWDIFLTDSEMFNIREVIDK